MADRFFTMATDVGTATLSDLDKVVESAQRCLPDLDHLLHDPNTDAATVAAIASRFDTLSRIGAAGTALAAKRAAELDVHQHTGHRNATDWLAQTAGIPFARAKEMLELPGHLDRSALAKEAFEQGQLSLSQAVTVGGAVATTPSSARRMLDVAQKGSHRDLLQEAARVQQAARSAEDERRRRARAYNRRSLRHCQLPEGGVRVQGYFTDEDWALCLGALTQRANERFRQGRAAKVHCTRDQYLADAAVDLLSGRHRSGSGSGSAAGADGAREPSGSSRPGVSCIVTVDAAALRRGTVDEGETCEIAGIGPVSVDAAKELLGEHGYRLLVTDGADVTTITSQSRAVPARVEAALFARDPSCVVPGCGVSIGLETHHWRREFHLGGPTELDNLCRLCAVHHDLVSHGGWQLAGGPGAWTWSAPSFAVSPTLQARRRQVQAARGRRQGRGSIRGRDGPD